MCSLARRSCADLDGLQKRHGPGHLLWHHLEESVYYGAPHGLPQHLLCGAMQRTVSCSAEYLSSAALNKLMQLCVGLPCVVQRTSIGHCAVMRRHGLKTGYMGCSAG